MKGRWLLEETLSIDRKKIAECISGTLTHCYLLLLAFLITGFLAFFSLPAAAGYPPMVPTLQPYRVVSPQGKWRLDVTPSNRQGAGPALTTLTNITTAEVVWKRMLPYTFWQCCVNDEGIVGGFAYTKGPLGEGSYDKDPGEYVLSFFDAQGLLMHEERSKRYGSSVGMGYYMPTHCAYRLLLDSENDRMILLMQDGQFRFHSMRDGTLLSAFQPEQKGDAFGYLSPDEIRFIPGTQFILLESNGAWGNDTETTSSSCVQLIDEDGRTVWAASQRKIYGPEKKWPFPKYLILDHVLPMQEEEPMQEEGNADPFDNDGAVVDPFAAVDPFTDTDEAPELAGPPTPTPVATFAVYVGDSEEKVVFRISDASINHGASDYRVAEVSREKYTLPPQQQEMDEDPKPPADFPKVEAKQLTKFPLKKADGSPMTGIAAVALGPEEKIHALPIDNGIIHVFDRDGKFLHVCDPGEQQPVKIHHFDTSIAVDNKGEVFARFTDWYNSSEDGKNSHDGLYVRFSVDGKRNLERLTPPSAENSGSVLVQPMTNNLIFYGFGHEVAVIRRDQYGTPAATLTQRADVQWLDFIRDVACAPDGTIAVRDSSRGNKSGGFITPFPKLPGHLPAETITLYQADGTPIRTLDFNRYAALTQIAFDGNHILAISSYDPPTPIVYVFTADGKPVGSILIAEFAGKESVNLRAFIVSEGKEILAVDLVSGMVYRYEMP